MNTVVGYDLPLIEKGLRQIELIMRQLLNFGRNEPLQTRAVDVAGLLSGCVDLLSFKFKNIRIDMDISVQSVHQLDAEALKQMLINVCLNAVQAMGDKGCLTIGCREPALELVMTFADTGPGISETDMATIFDPFFNTKDVGERTGLGLAVTYSLVQRMQGDIVVESDPNRGTRFTITIPVNNPDK